MQRGKPNRQNKGKIIRAIGSGLKSISFDLGKNSLGSKGKSSLSFLQVSCLRSTRLAGASLDHSAVSGLQLAGLLTLDYWRLWALLCITFSEALDGSDISHSPSSPRSWLSWLLPLCLHRDQNHTISAKNMLKNPRFMVF